MCVCFFVCVCVCVCVWVCVCGCVCVGGCLGRRHQTKLRGACFPFYPEDQINVFLGFFFFIFLPKFCVGKKV